MPGEVGRGRRGPWSVGFDLSSCRARAPWSSVDRRICHFDDNIVAAFATICKSTHCGLCHRAIGCRCPACRSPTASANQPDDLCHPADLVIGVITDDSGGEGGIRTHGGLPLTSLAGRPDRPDSGTSPFRIGDDRHLNVAAYPEPTRMYSARTHRGPRPSTVVGADFADAQPASCAVPRDRPCVGCGRQRARGLPERAPRPPLQHHRLRPAR